MSLSQTQKATFFAVARATLQDQWYRAAGSGERVTLASLYRQGLLIRRVHRGEGTLSPAHEYQLAEMARQEVLRSLQNSGSEQNKPPTE